MLDQLAMHHEKWLRMAFSFCKDKDMANDLVSDMYIKLSDCTEWNDYFVYYAIKHIYIDHLRYEKTRKNSERNFYDINVVGAQDKDHMMIEALIDEMRGEMKKKLTFPEREILLLRQTKSGRDIERQYDINYQKVHRIEKQAKDKLEPWVKKLEGLGM